MRTNTEWADAYQRTAVYGRFAEWNALCDAEGVTEDCAHAKANLGRWEQSEIGTQWAQCPVSTDGFRWFPVETVTEHHGFRGAAHGGFSFGTQLQEMRPECEGGVWKLVGRPVAAPAPEPAPMRLTHAERAAERRALEEAAVKRINAALETLAAECNANLHMFALFSRPGRVRPRGDDEAHWTLASRAVDLHLKFADQVALEDEVASICGLLAE